MKNLTDLRKTVEIGADRRSASARDYSMERFKLVNQNKWTGLSAEYSATQKLYL